MPETLKQLQEKERVRKDIEHQRKPKCPVCKKFLFESPRCACGGPGVTDSVAGDGAGKGDASAPAEDKGKALQSSDEVTAEAAHDSEDFTTELRLDEQAFDAEVISELLSSRRLVIDNDRDLGTLTIKLLCRPETLSDKQKEELHKYVQAILEELKVFRRKNNIAAKCKEIKVDANGNFISLIIKLPGPLLFDAFIQQLAEKFLLPVQNIHQQKGKPVEYPANENHFHPTPLRKTLAPAASNKTAEENAYSKDKKSIRPKTPADGCKPVGF